MVQVSDQTSGVEAGSQQTDVDGNYSIPLASGTYKVRIYGSNLTYDPSTYGYYERAFTLPGSFDWNSAAHDLVVTSNTTHNFTLPLVTMSGKTTDANGVAVGGVTIKQPNIYNYPNPSDGSSYYFVSNDWDSAPVSGCFRQLLNDPACGYLCSDIGSALRAGLLKPL